ncbi:MAG TPA: hypothetical protein VI933_01785 [archaeon]|nr:hypothetical protein [archaeon]
MTRAEDETLWRQCLTDMGKYLQTNAGRQTDGPLGEDFFNQYSREVVRAALEYGFGKLTADFIRVSKD